ncbi:hypothetical protein RO3G_04956 [Rhizopus delemar RA 99-880]|uniref:Nucleoside diphosphate kinase n=1 Tax=Rhizopus delemar (strain RA 99-880 / ATCC MYA-4621 / FGSC 9543 / NRRL 43880) TaxID=246409 RepID=I1BVM1_RHIO9|nr:hypothetical protein RO3G_04956 [Rhizopus delemar RA 99-880]|eukprot:EIE80251.1 hypothetical protein RO3G_04956 [Rhizopus delemar RA 99-880]
MTVIENKSTEIQIVSKGTINPTRETMVAIIKPDALSHKDAIVQRIQQEGFNILQESIFKITIEQARELYGNQNDYSAINEFIEWVSSSDLCALVIEKENAIKDFTELLGSKNSSKARKKKPKSLRALYGKDRFYNAVDGSESLENAQKEIKILFSQPKQSSSNGSTEMMNEMMSDPLPSPAASPVIEGSQSREIALCNQSVPAAKEKDTAQNVLEGASEQQKGISDTATEPTIISAKIEETNNPVQIALTDVTGKVKEEQTSESAVQEEPNMDTATHDVSVQQDNSAKVEEPSEPVTQDEIKTDGATQNISTDVSVQQRVSDEIEQQVLLTAKEEVEINDSGATSSISKDDSVQHSGLAKEQEQESISDIKNEEKSVVASATDVIHVFSTEKQNDVIEKEEQGQMLVTKEEEEKEMSVEKKDDINASQEALEEVSSRLNDTNKVKEQISITEVKEKTSISDSTPDTLIDTSSEQQNVASNDSSTKTSESFQDKSTKTSESLKLSPASSNNSVGNERRRVKVPLEKPAPSSSRLRQPLIKNTTKPSINLRKPTLSKVDRKPIPSELLKDVKGTSRIAKLSPTKASEEKKSTETAHLVKKKATKPSKNLPRVALLTNQKPKPETEQQETKQPEAKKKRTSSTKDFINRLTAPTVASINKKSETNNDAQPAMRVKKQTNTVKSSKVSPHDIVTKVND